MEYHFRNAKSENGHPKDELISALQKAVRRGNFELGAYVGIELELFSALPEAKALVTNAANRLRICLGEEIGVASPSTFAAFDKQYGIFEANRNATDDNGKQARRKAWISMIWLLCFAKKCRLLSWVKNAFLSPYNEHELVRKHFADHPANLLAQADIDSTPGVPFRLKSGDGAELQPIANGLLAAFWHRNVHTGMHWLNQLLSYCKRNDRAGLRKLWRDGRSGGTDPIFLLYDVAEAFFMQRLLGGSTQTRAEWKLAQRIVHVCRQYFWSFRFRSGVDWKRKSHRDWMIFVITPVLVATCLHRFEFDAAEPVAPVADDTVKHLYARNEERHQKMDLPDYCIDMHTLRGRRMGRGATHFGTVASLVENEHPAFADDALKALYVACKSSTSATTSGGKRSSSTASSPSNNSAKRRRQRPMLPTAAAAFVEAQFKPAPAELASVLRDAPVAQLVTSRSKQIVYVPLMSTRVYKGPYYWPAKKEMLANMLFRYDILKNAWNDNVAGPIETFRSADNVVYTATPSLARRASSMWANRKEQKESLLYGGDKFVIDKSSQGLQEFQLFVDGLIDKSDLTQLDRQVALDGVMHFAYRYIIDPSVGDAAMRNVLVVESREAVGIDLDDTAARQDVAGDDVSEETFVTLVNGSRRWGRRRVEFLDALLKRQSVRSLVLQKLADVENSLRANGPVTQVIERHGMRGYCDEQRMQSRCRRLKTLLQ